MKKWRARLTMVLGAVCVGLLLFAIIDLSLRTGQLRQALDDGNGETLLQLLRDGLDPHTEICTDYDRAAWTLRFPFAILPYQAVPNVCTHSAPLIVEASRTMSGTDGERVVTELLRRGVDINTGIAQMETPLSAALASNNSGMARFLLAHGANPNDGLAHYVTHSAIQFTDPALLRLLIQHGLPTQGTHQYDNALYWASSQGKIETVRFLLARGESPNRRLAEGTTPIMGAAENGRYSVVQLLLRQGAKPYIKDNNGNTALYFAIGNNDQNKNRFVINLLLHSGSSLFVKNKWQIMPLDLVEIVKDFQRVK